jgi:hypothetical protein
MQQKNNSTSLLTTIGKAVLILIAGALITYSIKNSTHIHTPYLITVAISIVIGIVSPRKGWISALALCAILAVGYFFVLGSTSHDNAQQDLEIFGLVGSMVLAFVGSFLGAYIKRAFD